MCELSDDEDGKGPREGSWGLLDLMGEWRPGPVCREGGKEGGEPGHRADVQGQPYCVGAGRTVA